MTQSLTGEGVPQPDKRLLSIPGSNSEAAQGFTAERVLRTRPKTYRAIVQLLADPHASVNQIAKRQRVHVMRPAGTKRSNAKMISVTATRPIVDRHCAELTSNALRGLLI
jgi:hypothetical protein